MSFVPWSVTVFLCVQVFLPDRLGELLVLLVQLLQVLVLLLDFLLSVPDLILQRGPSSFQLLLETGHLWIDLTSLSTHKLKQTCFCSIAQNWRPDLLFKYLTTKNNNRFLIVYPYRQSDQTCVYRNAPCYCPSVALLVQRRPLCSVCCEGQNVQAAATMCWHINEITS